MLILLLLAGLWLSPASLEALSLRLGPDQELKSALRDYARGQGLEAGCIVTCVGSLRRVELRLADQAEVTRLEGPFEILSLVGTLSPDGDHLHIALGDRTGRTVGGHLVSGTVYTTAEIVLARLPGRFRRSPDPATGHNELEILR